MRASRRRLLVSSLAAAAASGCATLLGHQAPRRPDVGTRAFVQRCFAGLDRAKVWDMHAHLVGIGAGGTGAWVNDAYRTELTKRALFELYLLAAGVEDVDDADAQYLERLVAQWRLMNPQGRVVLFAFDFRVTEDGQEDRARSEIHAPNAYVYDVARRYPDVFVPCASIHPYRKDALDRLAEAAANGAVAVKWLPNAQGIDPASPRCDAFYDALTKHGLVLVTHAGEEQAVDSAESQAWGDVLRLRRPLDRGVKVVVAHCAGLGNGADTDRGGEAESFDLFLRLMGEKQYEKTLYADISAMTQFNRSGRPLATVLKAKELHPRLVNGSDYPLPAINPLVSTRWLQQQGYLSKSDRIRCNEVFAANPLLFDFVVKRCLRVRDHDGEHRFAPVVFESARIFAS